MSLVPLHCPKCRAPAQSIDDPCAQCGAKPIAKFRAMYGIQAFVAALGTMGGYGLGFVGNAFNILWLGIAGLLGAFVCAVWLMGALWLLFRTNI
ncbi:MAG: hypothetical protein HUU60_05755 [Armatimonadetes bacterium]|nr:hypothetical protein [Armatimonadota bacterium]